VKKYIVGLVIFLGVVFSSFGGDFKVFGFSKDDNGSFSWSDYDITMGMCSYKENSIRFDARDNTELGSYIQIPMVQDGNARISVGIVFTLFDTKRSRPEFSVSYLLGEKMGLPKWMPLEIGAYWAVSPWNVVGGQVGLLKVDF
jgi:hypothetical protein